MSKPVLKLDWCSHAAARYACEKWHYSKKMPVFKTVKMGVWEDGVFVGAIIFGCGSTPEIGKPFGMPAQQVCELVRVALTSHATPVSRMIAVALSMLRTQSPGVRVVVSFADSREGHHGGIYQAGGWLYVGSFIHHVLKVHNEEVHPKTLHSRYGMGGQSIPWLRANVDPNATRIVTPPKHKYVMPLDDEMRAKILPLAKPYPKRARSIPADAPGLQPGEDGAAPIRALSA